MLIDRPPLALLTERRCPPKTKSLPAAAAVLCSARAAGRWPLVCTAAHSSTTPRAHGKSGRAAATRPTSLLPAAIAPAEAGRVALRPMALPLAAAAVSAPAEPQRRALLHPYSLARSSARMSAAGAEEVRGVSVCNWPERRTRARPPPFGRSGTRTLPPNTHSLPSSAALLCRASTGGGSPCTSGWYHRLDGK